MAGGATIRLAVPATPAHRALAVGVVGEATRLAASAAGVVDAEEVARLVADVVTAFGELFNNVALHAYARRGGPLDVAITIDRASLRLDLADLGRPFDPGSVPTPDLAALPQGGLGLYLARAVLDDLAYQPGPPNRWHLVKRLGRDAAAVPRATR